MDGFELPAQRLEVDGLDAQGVLEQVETTLRTLRAGEIDQLRLAAHWAMLHGQPPEQEPGMPRPPFADRLVRVGGDGTPPVLEFSLAELAIARQQHPAGCRALVADTLDLLHRLPRCWARAESLVCDAWLARRVARLTRALTKDQADLVDRAVAPFLGAQAPSRVIELTEAKVIEADPDAHAARIEAEARRRCVHLGRSTDAGLKVIFARLDAGDATWVDAMVDRVARILASQGQPGSLEELRAVAFGWLARPAELLTLLLEHQVLEQADPAPAVGDPDEEPVSRATRLPAEIAEALRSTDLERLRPRGVLHVHVREEVLEGRVDGVVRCEGLGPFLPEQLHLLLGHAQVRVEPVVNLADQVSVSSYWHPEAVKNRIYQIIGGDYFPYAPSTDRDVDYDHVEAYRADGPPGQTGTHNSGPLTRPHHRIKTHGRGWVVRQPGPGVYVWRTPHSLYRLVDHRGTHVLTAAQGAARLDQAG